MKLIKRYVEEKDIVRPQDMVVKSVVNKSGNKVFVIQSIDRKMVSRISPGPATSISTSC